MQIQTNPRIIAAGHRVDAAVALAAVQDGRMPAVELLAQAEAAATGEAAAHAFVRRFRASALAQARGIDAMRDGDLPLPTLAGLPVSVKDLFDVAGQPTTAASPTLADAAPALQDAAAVARLRTAGAVLVGHTNMTEFAYSGLGLNPHYETPVNPVAAVVDTTPRIPGGSTSGGAVSVACGAAWAALGSDTGGSLRIPAALQGLVGFKPTQARVPRTGMLPLARSLDTAGCITLSVRDAVRLDAVLAADDGAGPTPVGRVRARAARAWRVAVPTTTMLDDCDDEVARAFELALARLREAGMQVDEVAMPALADATALAAQGVLATCEAWAWHRHRIASVGEDYDPRVRVRIQRGARLGAADYLDALDLRREWQATLARDAEGVDAWLSPTVPRVAPALAPLEARDELYARTNALMLRNPSVVNLLDGCALSLPCQAPGTLPVGLMLWAPAFADARLLSLALTVEAVLGVAQRSARRSVGDGTGTAIGALTGALTGARTGARPGAGPRGDATGGTAPLAGSSPDGRASDGVGGGVPPRGDAGGVSTPWVVATVITAATAAAEDAAARDGGADVEPAGRAASADAGGAWPPSAVAAAMRRSAAPDVLPPPRELRLTLRDVEDASDQTPLPAFAYSGVPPRLTGPGASSGVAGTGAPGDGPSDATAAAHDDDDLTSTRE